MKSDHIKRLITLTSDYNKRLSLYNPMQKTQAEMERSNSASNSSGLFQNGLDILLAFEGRRHPIVDIVIKLIQSHNERFHFKNNYFET